MPDLGPEERAAVELAMSRAVAALLDDRELFEKGEIDDDDARLALSAFLAAVPYAIGDRMRDAVFGRIDSAASRSQTLTTIAWRVDTLGSAAGMIDNGAGMDPVCDEILAIAGGDTPAIFARIGDKKIKVREMRGKLTALCWDAFLDAQGLSPVERHATISTAYDTEWPTIPKWEKPVRAALGDGYVDRAFRLARKAGHRHDERRAVEIGRSWSIALKRDSTRLQTLMRQSRYEGSHIAGIL